jgi:hypothetical protein
MIMIEAMSVRFGMKLSLARGGAAGRRVDILRAWPVIGGAGSVIAILSARATIRMRPGAAMRPDGAAAAIEAGALSHKFRNN